MLVCPDVSISRVQSPAVQGYYGQHTCNKMLQPHSPPTVSFEESFDGWEMDVLICTVGSGVHNHNAMSLRDNASFSFQPGFRTGAWCKSTCFEDPCLGFQSYQSRFHHLSSVKRAKQAWNHRDQTEEKLHEPLENVLMCGYKLGLFSAGVPMNPSQLGFAFQASQ